MGYLMPKFDTNNLLVDISYQVFLKFIHNHTSLSSFSKCADRINSLDYLLKFIPE